MPPFNSLTVPPAGAIPLTKLVCGPNDRASGLRRRPNIRFAAHAISISRSSAPPIRCRLTRFVARTRPTGSARVYSRGPSLNPSARKTLRFNAERTEISHATGSKDHRPYLRSPYNRPMASHAYYRSNARSDQCRRRFNGYRGDGMGHKPLVITEANRFYGRSICSARRTVSLAFLVT